MVRRNFPSRAESANEIAGLKDADKLVGSYQPTALSFRAASRRVDWLADPSKMGASLQLALFLYQLEEEGLGDCSHDGEMLITWQQVYEIKSSWKYGTSYPLLGLPPLSTLRPYLANHGSFSDSDFSIFVSGWVGDDGSPLVENPRISGAIVATSQQEALLAPEVWRTLTGVAAFHERRMGERTTESNQICWAKIRQHAKAAGARLSHFLESTVVVAPETLTVGLRKSYIAAGTVIEVLPTFKGHPAAWLETFDRFGQVRDHYEVPDGAGLTHVLITPQVRTVLSEIKRMPRRRVAGERAEAFLRNPYATLGPDACEVIGEEQFEQARAKAGISFARFAAQLQHDGPHSRFRASLLIEEGDLHTGCSHVLPFADPDELEEFIAKVEERRANEAQCCPWRGYELEILGDTPDQLAILAAALQKWRRDKEYKPSEIFDLSYYSGRVEGFGLEKPYYLPCITRKRDAYGWFPDNVIFAARYKPEGPEGPVATALSAPGIQQLERLLRTAKDKDQSEFVVEGFPKPITVHEAEAMVTAFREAERDLAARSFGPNKAGARLTARMNGLIVKANVDEVDYAEPYGDLGVPTGSKPLLPTSLKTNVRLLEHQLAGVAWLQHLWGRSPRACRGALLADEMGLGKTLQLLTFIVWCLEHDPAVDPFLIVAPVSLLENWKQEINKFFEPGTLPVLTLYGPTLREKRLPRATIQEELLRAGIARLLTRGWLGNAKVVLTTYETLRDLEFSLARQKWSVMVCDEAQKIKTPNAMVSRAAKKQNARFKVACTGTPVENTLTDLWCLFDFIQPGLLGSLRCFAERYRRPIEAETDEEKSRVEELRRLIASQTLRRSKAEVAQDLPRKIVDRGCRALPISEEQRLQYHSALSKFSLGHGAGSSVGFYDHIRLLLHLRKVCSDPRSPGHDPKKLRPLAELERCSPKMRWMLTELLAIRARGEKAIVFCEFRDLQRTIQHAIFERLTLIADIINGDTSAADERADNRQKRIEIFQKKPGFGVIILSPAAVGFGLNIQAANHVIHFTRAWNPAREDQATDRAYRIGQDKDVFVYYPAVVAGDFATFDEKLDRLLEIKRKLSQDMLNGCSDVAPSDFSDLKRGEVDCPVSECASNWPDL